MVVRRAARWLLPPCSMGQYSSHAAVASAWWAGRPTWGCATATSTTTTPRCATA
ncbi:hypothetical protein ACP70R_032620 [Stipagrostis hirtigluma subsp. patula]